MKSYSRSAVYLFLITAMWSILMGGCAQELQFDESPQAMLEFSEDTVVFDTILTSRTSITKRFRIRNPNSNAIKINEIKIASANSPYKMIVNGKQGNSIRDEVIRGQDSLLMLIEVTIDPQDENLPFLVKDSILVDWNENIQDIKLVSYGQDAIYLGNELICDETWTNERPYVIFSDVLVDSLCTLNIEAGARVFLDVGVRFFVQGKLIVKGDSGNRVVFRNSRFDENYIEAPGQWDGIYLLEGSKDNEVEFAIIENNRFGFRMGTPDSDTIPDLQLKNTIIRHSSENAILSFTSDIYAENCLMYNSGGPVLLNVAGGNYSYLHCTIANSPNFFFVEDPAVIFSDNILLENNQRLVEELNVNLKNSIIYGSNEEELFFSITEEVPVSLVVKDNLISGNIEFEGNRNSTESNFPGFIDPFSFNYGLDSLSIAIDAANSDFGFDLDGKARDSQPDIGAFEYIKGM